MRIPSRMQDAIQDGSNGAVTPSAEIGNNRDHGDSELRDSPDHPRPQQHQYDRRNEQFRDVGKRHFLKLRRDLQDTDDQSGQQSRYKHGPRDKHRIPQELV